MDDRDESDGNIYRDRDCVQDGRILVHGGVLDRMTSKRTRDTFVCHTQAPSLLHQTAIYLLKHDSGNVLDEVLPAVSPWPFQQCMQWSELEFTRMDAHGRIARTHR